MDYFKDEAFILSHRALQLIVSALNGSLNYYCKAHKPCHTSGFVTMFATILAATSYDKLIGSSLNAYPF